ncbi:sensor histidine kinase [Novosphingobium colocasiae]
MRARGNEWRIDVIDTGIGIPEDRLGAIFGEFTRIGEIDVDGLGLGLALVERITRLLGGRIDVVSAPGKGSRFSLSLPKLHGSAPARSCDFEAVPRQRSATTVRVGGGQ